MIELPRYPFYDGHVQERMRRADGRCVCDRCGKAYCLHPMADEYRIDGYPFLHVLCDGSLVKL